MCAINECFNQKIKRTKRIGKCLKYNKYLTRKLCGNYCFKIKENKFCPYFEINTEHQYWINYYSHTKFISTIANKTINRDNTLYIFTDASFYNDYNISLYGIIIMKNGKVVDKFKGIEKVYSSLEAEMNAIEKILYYVNINYKDFNIIIYTDCEEAIRRQNVLNSNIKIKWISRKYNRLADRLTRKEVI